MLALSALEVLDPTAQQWIQLLDRMGQRLPTPTAQPFAHSLHQSLHALRRDPYSSLALSGEAEPQEPPYPGPCYRTLLGVHLQVQDLLEEDPDPAHDTLARYATAHVDVAVISIAAEGKSSSFQLPIQVRQEDIG